MSKAGPQGSAFLLGNAPVGGTFFDSILEFTMQRHLTALSLFALFVASPALAQAPAPAPVPSTQLEQSGLTPPTVLSQGYANKREDVLVTMLLGQSVYASAEADADVVGVIGDMVITAGTGITAVVIGVGGFMGMGDKDVALDFTQLQWTELPDGSRRWVLTVPPETLADAPAFIWADSEEVTGEAMSPAQEQEQMVEGDPNAAPVDPNLTTDQPNAVATPDRSGLSVFDATGLTGEQLRGIGVYGLNDEQIGTIGDVLTNPDGGLDAVIVDVGGFLGLGAKPVAVGADNLAFSADTLGNRYLFLNASREQLETQPAYDPTTYPAEREAQRMVITP